MRRTATTAKRKPGRPSNRGQRPSRPRPPRRLAPTLDEATGIDPGQPLGRAVETLGSKYARAVALTILGPAPPEPPPRFQQWSPLDALVSPEAPDLVSDPVAKREVILRSQFGRVIRAGGIAAYVLSRFKKEPAKYTVHWIGPTTETLVEATYVVPEPREQRERREEQLREMEERRLSGEREEAERRARESAALDRWVAESAFAFAQDSAYRGDAWGVRGTEFLSTIEAYLRKNAWLFVETRYGRPEVAIVQASGKPPARVERWNPRAVWFRPKRSRAELWRSLQLLLPPAIGDAHGRA